MALRSVHTVQTRPAYPTQNEICGHICEKHDKISGKNEICEMHHMAGLDLRVLIVEYVHTDCVVQSNTARLNFYVNVAVFTKNTSQLDVQLIYSESIFYDTHEYRS